MAIPIRFDQFINDPRVWQAFVQENGAFFGTPAGQALMTQLTALKKRYGEIEAHIRRYPNSSFNWQAEKEKLKTQWQGLRTSIRSDPTNPANGGGPPAAAGPAPGPAPAAAAAPPVYLPNYAAPTYAFPSADAVRDMTYDPGIGGFLRPNNPGAPGGPMGPTQPSPNVTLPGFGTAPTSNTLPRGFNPVMTTSPFTGFVPQAPQAGNTGPPPQNASAFPWQPGF